MNVALTFNVKPDEDSLTSSTSNASHHQQAMSSKAVDTYSEWDTWDTVNAVKAALEEFNSVMMIEADFFSFEKLRDSKPEIVFNIAEGINGASREAQIPAMLDMLNIPYTGSDAATLSICLDKARAKEILTYYGIPTAKFFVVTSPEEANDIRLPFPLIIKPNLEGSSKGIFSSSFVTNKEELKREVERILFEYNEPALIEEFLPGREFTVALLGNGSDVEVLPLIELKYNSFPENFIPIYSYEAKWILDTSENPLNVFSCPAQIDSALEEKIRTLCARTFNVLRCKDWSRIDVRINKNGEPCIIEVNPLPGILPNPNDNSCFPKAARTAGYNYTTMINKVLHCAARRYNIL